MFNIKKLLQAIEIMKNPTKKCEIECGNRCCDDPAKQVCCKRYGDIGVFPIYFCAESVHYCYHKSNVPKIGLDEFGKGLKDFGKGLKEFGRGLEEFGENWRSLNKF